MARVRVIVPIVVAVLLGVGVWLWLTAGQETTDDAQTEAHVVQISARVGGTVLSVPVKDNQPVEAGATLVALDPQDYQIAVDKARAELADADATAKAARSSVPVLTTSATTAVTSAQSALDRARAGVDEAQKAVESARAQLAGAKSNVLEVQANMKKAVRDADRLKGLLAKDEVSQQQYDAAEAAADAQKAAVEAAQGGVGAAGADVQVAQSRLMQARATEDQARAALESAKTAPHQITAILARAAAAEAHVEQLRAQLAQAELNLQYATVKAPVKGIVSRKSVEPGQIVQPNQPLLSIIPLGDIWVIANFKETQLEDMRPGQRARVKVDAIDGRTFTGKVDSIAAATGARFALLPPENATGNFVKVVQRVPVKIVLDPGQDPDRLLRPGLSAEPTVYTK